MQGHNWLRMWLWVVMVGAIVLIAAHGSILFYVSSHTVMSVAIVSSVLILVVVKHLGLLGPLLCLVPASV